MIEELKKTKKESGLAMICEAKRKRAVIHDISSAIPDMGIDSSIGDPISAIFSSNNKIENPSKDEIKWDIELSKKPQILCNINAEYDGVENQRVIAISYGKFHFKKGNVDNSIVPPEIIGVTRLGNDGVHHYFILAQLDKINLKDSFDIGENDKKFEFKLNGKKAVIIDDKTQNPVYSTIESEKIPKDLYEFFAKTFFSDAYLDRVIAENNRYAGSVYKKPSGQIQFSMPAVDYQKEAIKDAMSVPGSVGNQKMTLKEFFNRPELVTLHYKLITDIINQISISETKRDNNENSR